VDGQTLTHVRLYKVDGRVELSDFVPTLESLGLRVIEEWPTTLLGEDGDERFLHDFGVLDTDHRPIDVEASGRRVAECIGAGVARGVRVRLAQSPGRLGRHRLAAGADPARLSQVPPPGELDLPGRVQERRLRGAPARRRAAGAAVRDAVRPLATA
jgi:hypothetical protein